MNTLIMVIVVEFWRHTCSHGTRLVQGWTSVTSGLCPSWRVSVALRRAALTSKQLPASRVHVCSDDELLSVLTVCSHVRCKCHVWYALTCLAGGQHELAVVCCSLMPGLRALSRYYHHPNLLVGRAACRSREDVVRLLLGMKAPSRVVGSGSVPTVAASRKSSRSKGSGTLHKAAAAAAAKAASANGKTGTAAPAGPADGTEPQQSQRTHPGDNQHEQEEEQQQLKLRKPNFSVQDPSSPRSPCRPASSPRGVASPRKAAAFSPARQQPAPAAAEPAGRSGRRRAAAAAAAALQAASADGVEEDEAAPVARSRGGRVLKRSAAAQVRSPSSLPNSAWHVLTTSSKCWGHMRRDQHPRCSQDGVYQPSSDDGGAANEGPEDPTDDEWEVRCGQPIADLRSYPFISRSVDRSGTDQLTTWHKQTHLLAECRRAVIGASLWVVQLMSCRLSAAIIMSSHRRRALSRVLAAAAYCGSSRTSPSTLTRTGACLQCTCLAARAASSQASTACRSNND